MQVVDFRNFHTYLSIDMRKVNEKPIVVNLGFFYILWTYLKFLNYNKLHTQFTKLKTDKNR